jgi:pilus assembly protein Flp/PilA
VGYPEADTFFGTTWWSSTKGAVVSLMSYLELVVTPFVRARLGHTDDRGASLVEYALLVALIAVVCILAVSFLGGRASDKLSQVGSAVGG